MIKDSIKLFKLGASREAKKLLAIILVLEVGTVGVLYKLNQVYGQLYEGIQKVDTTKIYTNIAYFTGIAMFLVLINGGLVALLNRLAFSLRTGLTRHFLLDFDRIKDVNNVGQRVQEDLRKFSDTSVELWVGVFKAAIKLPLFLGVVISLTQWYVGLIILAVVVAGTYLTRYMAGKLSILTAQQESNEAEFRSSVGSVSLSRVLATRTNHGEWVVHPQPTDAYAPISKLFPKINHRLKMLAFTQSGLGQAFVLVPFIVLMPLYIAKVVTMGVFFQAVNALGKVIDSLTILIDSRQTIVGVESSIVRLKSILS